MLQLHARIRENELRAQQVLHSQRWFEDPQILTMKVILPKPPEIQCGWNLETLFVVTLFFYFLFFCPTEVREGRTIRSTALR